MRFIFIFLLFTGIVTAVSGQQFYPVSANLTGLGGGYAVWGDYDNDNDLDLAVQGHNVAGVPTMKMYRNDAGSFQDAGVALEGLSTGSLEWGDYDNDGDLDLLATGLDDLNAPVSVIFSNQGGVFSPSPAVIPSLSDSQAAWGDFDNDGDLDILMAGRESEVSFRALILRNDGNDLFTDIGASLPGVQNASVSWADYNNDGLMDALIGGDSGGGMITRLFKNTGSGFEEVFTDGFTGLSAGDQKWGDLDKDGDLDVIVTGVDLYLDGHVLIYENKGLDDFKPCYNLESNLLYTSVDIGDYDNDGWPDIVLMGRYQGCGGSALVTLFHNDMFLNFTEVNPQIPGCKKGSVFWGDYNNDGCSDMLVTGFDVLDNPVTAIYRNGYGNSSFTVNTPPAAPQGLQPTIADISVTLAWNGATDNETPGNGLVYNLYIGTGPGLTDVLDPMAVPASGFRKLATRGNAGHDTSWSITGLEPGDYFWSVQTIDNGFSGSLFSAENFFTIYATSIRQDELAGFSIVPNPVSDILTLNFPCENNYLVSIWSGDGRMIYNVAIKGQKMMIDATGFESGIYLVRVSSGPEVWTRRFIRK